MDERQTGFEEPREPQDNWTKKLYQSYDLGERPSLEDIEDTAIELLGNPLTLLEGAGLVLGRRVDSNEQQITKIAANPFTSPQEKFAMLLLVRTDEGEKRK